MSEPSRLEQGRSLLRNAFGRVDEDESSTGWPRFLRVLLGVAPGHSSSSALDELLASSPLATPGQAAAATAGQLSEVLKPIPRGSQKGGVVRAVAAWWMAEFGDDLSPEWPAGSATCRESLRRIRGLGPVTVDELLLAMGLKLFPIGRAVLRVAVRHGWLDLSADDEEAQAFFVRGSNPSVRDLQELSRLLGLVGEAHCGREPRCDGCPLQPLLPAGGPLDPHSC